MTLVLKPEQQYSSKDLIQFYETLLAKKGIVYDGDQDYTVEDIQKMFVAPQYFVTKKAQANAFKLVAKHPDVELSEYFYFVPLTSGGAAYKRLRKLTVKELVELAKKKKVPYSKLRKHELILAIQAKRKQKAT